MKIINEEKLFFFGGLISIILLIFTSCVTFNQESVGSGKYFLLIYNTNSYDPTIPLEEMCYLINLSDNNFSRITSINGESPKIIPSGFKSNLLVGEFVILQPGILEIIVNYGDIAGRSADVKMQPYTAKPGDYLFISGGSRGGNTVAYRIGNLKDPENKMVLMSNGGAYSKSIMISSESLISGMRTAVKRELKR